MAMTDVEHCSAALVKLGAAPIASLAEPSAAAEIARRLYPIVRDAALSSHPWSFTMAQTALNRSATDPSADFNYAFALPADLLRCVSAGSAGRGRGIVYRLIGMRLEADVAEVTLTYQRRPAEADFSPSFSAALVSRLAAELCLPMTENASRAEILHRLAQSELQLARLIDSQQQTPKAIEDYTLIEARWS